MSKILKPYTIIPPDLYVQRDADRQIKNIIKDMGRPGYVLVSRQMGKTNLLINAKRRLETKDDAFVYIDLSSHFENAKSCFENIIDTALETYKDKFVIISDKISKRRKEFVDTPPHKQHTNELRQLLEIIPGKLVIILDEIDALTKTSYSDQIFSLIRSIYFARVNYPEFERLTYILSGVIEPSEIIKDSRISPFNIGQKIFLNDFSRNEFDVFISNAKINLKKEVVDRIYFWTNGSPRMTWDISSEVENIGKDNEITIAVIDQIVKELYLTKYDKPPVDHIRELVINDRELRNSIIEIEYHKGNVISDKIRSKLYLSGIINYDESEIHIKNEIIRHSISYDWIKSLESEYRNLVNNALEQVGNGDFEEAIKSFERYLLSNEFDEDEKPYCYYNLGYSYYRVSEFSKAIEALGMANFDREENGKLYLRFNNLKGLVYFYRGEIKEALECFKNIIDNSKKDEMYVRALLNYGSTALKSNSPDYEVEAREIFKNIIDEVGFDKEKLKEEFINEIKSISHYNLAEIEKRNNNLNETIINYKLAIKYGKPRSKPSILLYLLLVTENKEDRYALIDEILDIITSKDIRPIENDLEKPLTWTFDELKTFLIIIISTQQDSLFLKIQPLFELLGKKSLSNHLIDLVEFSIYSNGDVISALVILNKLVDNFTTVEFEVNDEIKYKVLKLKSYFNTENIIHDYFSYLSIFEKYRYTPIDYYDMVIIAKLVQELTDQKEYERALYYAELLDSLKDEVPKEIFINYLVIYNQELNLHYYLNNFEFAIKKAKKILTFIEEEIYEKNTRLLGEKGLEIIKSNATDVLNRLVKKQPVKVHKQYERNDKVKVRYRDGTIIETKYKRVSDDIFHGRCIILTHKIS